MDGFTRAPLRAAKVPAGSVRLEGDQAIPEGSRGLVPFGASAGAAPPGAPTLLIVGGRDPEVIRLNSQAFDLLPCERAPEVIPRAMHLFEEPGALGAVRDHAARWFGARLG